MQCYAKRTTAVLLAGLAAFALTATPLCAADPEVTVGVAGSSSQIALLAFNVARTKGFIEENGVKLKVIDFGSGAKGIQAFVGGDVDFVAATLEHVIRLRSKGVAARSVVAASKAPGIVMSVSKRFAPQYKDARDLVGKNVGVSAPGSASHTFLNLFLARKGVKPDQVSVIGVGNAGGAIAAMRTGNELVAIVNYDPVITMLNTSGDAKPVIDLRDIKNTKEELGTDFTFLSLITTDQYIQKNPKAVQAVVSGMVKALKWIPTATPEQVRAAVPEEFWKAEPELYLQSIKSNLSGLATDGLITKSEAEGVYQILLKDDPSVDPKKVDFAQTFDNSFVEKALGK